MCSLFLALIADLLYVSAKKYRHQGEIIRPPRLTLWEVPVIGRETDLPPKNSLFSPFSSFKKLQTRLNDTQHQARQLSPDAD